MEKQRVYFILGILLILNVIVLIVLLHGKKRKEGYKKCMCSSSGTGRERKCQDTEIVEQNYVSNKLTEFTDLKSRDWNQTSSGDYNFPASVNCNWTDETSNTKWKEWDFTDF
jgi:hypothetical protein